MSKIPFSWLPASWGLKGKSRELAEAEYYLTGYELDIAKARIGHGLESPAFTRSVLDIDLAYGKISAYDHDTRLAEIDHSDETALAMAKLDVDLKHNRVSAQEHERKRADILNEPFMAMPKISWDPVDPSKTFFELDYNQAFVEWLRSNGYNNVSDEEAINRWLNDVCNSILSEMAPTDPEFVSNVRRIRRDDGITEHS
jgi:hypothetical protein